MVYFSAVRARIFGFFLCLLTITGARHAIAAWSCEERPNDCHNVYVVSDRWHAGIVMRMGEVSPKRVPEIGDFSGFEMIEFSWGDKDYFPDPDPGIHAALRAAFWSRGSVLHLVGFHGPVEDFYRSATINEFRLTRPAFERLVAFLAKSFDRPDPALPAAARPGIFSYSRFYSAVGKFSLARTCNTWVAQALQHAGLSVDAPSVITSGQLNAEIARFAVPK
jgi:uncharacterized protein (TIGR02117 family)